MRGRTAKTGAGRGGVGVGRQGGRSWETRGGSLETRVAGRRGGWSWETGDGRVK